MVVQSFLLAEHLAFEKQQHFQHFLHLKGVVLVFCHFQKRNKELRELGVEQIPLHNELAVALLYLGFQFLGHVQRELLDVHRNLVVSTDLGPVERVGRQSFVFEHIRTFLLLLVEEHVGRFVVLVEVHESPLGTSAETVFLQLGNVEI